MGTTRRAVHSAQYDRVRAALITCVLLCIANYGIDVLINNLGMVGDDPE